MAGKQLEKILKSIERQLLKLVLSHALKTLASLSVRYVTGKKALKAIVASIKR